MKKDTSRTVKKDGNTAADRFQRKFESDTDYVAQYIFALPSSSRRVSAKREKEIREYCRVLNEEIDNPAVNVVPRVKEKELAIAIYSSRPIGFCLTDKVKQVFEDCYSVDVMIAGKGDDEQSLVELTFKA